MRPCPPRRSALCSPLSTRGRGSSSSPGTCCQIPRCSTPGCSAWRTRRGRWPSDDPGADRPADAKDRIDGILGHFEDLTHAYDAVQRARAQLEALQPLVATASRYDAALERRDTLQQERVAVRPFFAELRNALRQAETDGSRT